MIHDPFGPGPVATLFDNHGDCKVPIDLKFWGQISKSRSPEMPFLGDIRKRNMYNLSYQITYISGTKVTVGIVSVKTIYSVL